MMIKDRLIMPTRDPQSTVRMVRVIWRSLATRLLAYQASQLFFTDLIIELLRGLYQNPKIDESSYEGKDIEKIDEIPNLWF